MAVSWRITLKEGHSWGIAYGVFRGAACVCIPIDQIEGMSAQDIGENMLSLVPEACCAEAHELSAHCDPDYLANGPTHTLEQWREVLFSYREHSPSIMQAWINVASELNTRTARQEKRNVKMNRAPRVKQPGYVYLLQAGPFFKIGVSADVGERLKQLSTLPPFDIELLHSIPTLDMYALESKLHVLYAPKRKNGEWFELDDSDVEYIKGL